MLNFIQGGISEMGENKRRRTNQKTQQYQIKKSKKSENKQKKGKKKHPKLKKVILIIFAILILLVLTAIGAVAGIFFSDKWKIEKGDLMITEQNSSVYDAENNYLGQLIGNENRIIIPLSEMGEYIPKAFVAIEDERFDEHSGIDFKRTLGATVQYILHRGSSSYGGSTITQQLVKNMMKDKDDEGFAGAERKIREMSRAYQIEQMLSKNQILELYLNEIFMGGSNIHGVESASQYYFAKSAKELSLAQSAFLAGINDGPNLYNPYGEDSHKELITRRTKTVLGKMKELGKINEEEYNGAVEEVEKGFEFKRGETSQASNLSFLAIEAISEAAADLAELKDVDFETAKMMLKSGGYKLYTTLQPDVQKAVDKEFDKTSYVTTKTETVKDKEGNSKKVTYTAQASMTIMNYRTGEVVAMAGSLGKEQNNNSWNLATRNSRQPGSSIKPLANIAPGLQEKVITAATVYDDTRTTFGKDFSPKNSTGYKGLCTVRKAIEASSNVVNVKILYNVGFNTAVKYLNNFGLTGYGEADKIPSLGIGGTSGGTNTYQMAAAYGAIANKGEYIEPTCYKRLEDSNGKTIVEPKQEKRRILSEENAYILSDILTGPVKGSDGTARICAISGMDVAAKTGTTDAAGDKWLCGFTPYYSASVWYGYREQVIPVSYPNAAKQLWKAVMTEVHKGLKNATFEKPSNIVSATICKTSGKLATSACKSTYTEYFVKGTVPDKCDGHVIVKLCKASGKVATTFCPEVEEKVYTAKPEKENNAAWKTNGSDKYNIPKETCPLHTAETSKIAVVNVVGKTEEEAKTALAGLNIQVIYEHNAAIANGKVIRQSLAPDTKVDKGVTIVITVNKLSGTSETPGGNTQTPSTKPTTPTTPETPTTPSTPNAKTQTPTVPEKPNNTSTTGNNQTPGETTSTNTTQTTNP